MGFIQINTIGCKVVAIIMHYLYLSLFFWMNSMSVQVWITFRKTQILSNFNKKPFIKYSLYSWISPALIVMIAIIIDFTGFESEFRPYYGYRLCWISKRYALLIFFALPSGILIMTNTVLFILTFIVFYKLSKEAKILNRSENRFNFYLCAKLVLIMGLTWILAFMSAITESDILWYLYILLNGSQGTTIFLMFTFRRIINKIKSK
jgi:hypothetical protein